MAEENDIAVTLDGLQAQLRQYVPPGGLARERDALGGGRWRIQTGQPLVQFGSEFAKAYAAQDTQEAGGPQLYALVFENHTPLRHKNIDALKEYRHPNLLPLVAAGVAEISLAGEARFVAILERPRGQKLAEMLAGDARNPLSEQTLINFVLRPLTEILRGFASLGISHNRINLDSLYVHEGLLLLGECISEPSGHSQDALFEPVERLLCSPGGKADYAIGADCYALGMVCLHMALGFLPFARVTKEALTNSLLENGSYHTLVIQWDLSEALQDLFRALLNDSKQDRWAPEYIENWLAGRRFNLILPSNARETARGFDFGGRTFFNRRSLAHAMFLQWEEARALLFDTRLARWIETGLHKAEPAEQVTRLASNNMGDTAKAERHNNELLSKIIIVLDPTGPVRYERFSFSADGGIAGLLAQAQHTGNRDDLRVIAQILEGDLVAYWGEQQKTGLDYTALATRLQKMRSFLRTHAPGFGMERCLYDLHPALPCQSPMVRQLRPVTLAEILLALDLIAPQRGPNDDFMDAHIAAFIASRLELGKELRIHELDTIPDPASHTRLTALRLLARAQGKLRALPPLRGLCLWVALRLFPLLDYIHKRDLRQQLKQNFQATASEGRLAALADMLLGSEVFLRDHAAFKRAAADYAKRKAFISLLRNKQYRELHARMMGRGLSQALAYCVCLATIYFTLRAYFHI